MNSAQSPLDPERQKASSNYSTATEGRRAQAYSPLPQVEALPGKKRKSWLVPLVAAFCIAGTIGLGSFEYLSHQAPAPASTVAPVATQQSAKDVLTLSGADLNEAKTAQAIADIKADVNSPLVAHLTDQMKQEFLSGERKFYSLPVANPATEHQAASALPGNSVAPDTSPSASTPTTQSALAPAATQPEQAQQQAPIPTGDRVSISINGALYGVYDLTNMPLTIDFPFKIGDQWTVTCIAVGEGRLSVVVGIANVLNPVQTTALTPGETANFTVGPITYAPNYAWFQQQAQSGNAVAEYGMGHMYQYGIGVQQDNSQAIYWYRQAAAQNYGDAKAQLVNLGAH